MTTLVVGASGATGRLLVQQLLERGESVRAIVRATSGLPESIAQHEGLSIIRASVLDLSAGEMARHVDGCRAVASCLGHNLSLKGIYGQPRRLVTDATRRLCEAIASNGAAEPVKFVLMNTTGNRNRGVRETVSFAEKCVLGMIRLLVPPHADNEQAAEYLRTTAPSWGGAIEWAAVRPDSLIDEDDVSDYDVHPSPTRSAIFNAGKTSRINVAHFMAELIGNEETWNEWKGSMPVIYNRVPTGDAGGAR